QHVYTNKRLMMTILYIFFFQAEDGIRDATVTGVQTCALPITGRLRKSREAFSARLEDSRKIARCRPSGHRSHYAKLGGNLSGHGPIQKGRTALSACLSCNRENVRPRSSQYSVDREQYWHRLS